MSLTDVHGRLANTVLLYLIVMVGWGLWRFFRKEGVGSSFWGALIIAEILIIVQGLLGGYLWLTGLQPDRGWIHILYGVVAATGIPAAYIYTKGREDRSTVLVYSLLALFLVGIALRAMSTGG
ncbi:MAG: hypothetical protein PVG32_07760 [Anaerolineales bacterium]|jgi:hypothetical protein